jgi:hypothetical protein
MRALSNLPPGVTDRMIEEHLGAPAVEGMGLRDYFAAKAMASMLMPEMSSSDFPNPDYVRDDGKTVKDTIAERAYAFADAMLATRGEG